MTINENKRQKEFENIVKASGKNPHYPLSTV